MEDQKAYWKYVLYRMDDEGFHYCFIHFSNWEEIKDEKFHQLRNQYIKSAEELKKYIQSKNETT